MPALPKPLKQFNAFYSTALLHFQQKEKYLERLRKATEPANAIEEPELQAAIESFGQVVNTALRIAVPTMVGIDALFEVNRKIATQKPAMPFSSFMDDDTLKKYPAVVALHVSHARG